ncbi:SH3 domain-containing protein 19-like [Electrophorus electricus]|uniref:SH3 domain-containing protein 19-like n=1 Tax=Electrophorus electricus TaxID=8005 RepID=UPI0015D0C4B4|nr:SH3 domain-containing protein 19-like [Electrophorus electricus]
MTALHNDRNIRARIQAFERQTGSDEAATPSPRPRNIYSKTPVAPPKPSVAPRPTVSRPAEEEAAAAHENVYENVDIALSSPAPGPAQDHLPVSAPRPLPPRKPSLGSREESKPKPPVKTACLLPPRPSLLRSKNLSSQEEEVVIKGPPPPVMPSKELLQLNNHNSPGLLRNATRTLVENSYVDLPSSNGSAKPSHGGLFPPALSTQPISRRPTVIRVPSTSNKFEQKASDFTPPLAIQGAVGGTPLPLKSTRWDPFGGAADLTLPTRPSGGKVPPPRPPPAKTGPARPLPPRRDSYQRAPLQQGVPLHPPSQMQHRQSHKPSRKGPVLPPRPNPGHHLYNSYTLEIPHGIAQFDYNGTRTGELSFQKNEVLVLLNQTDSRTFECQVGDARGTVQDSYMKIITPLTNYSHYADNPVPQESRSVEDYSLQVQALYDFTPEGPGELGLRAGDIVSDVEQLDTEWYMGTCRGTKGFFPINYVKLLSGPTTPAVAPTNERRTQQSAATVSGPRCVARFDFEGEQSDELTFCEGNVIRLREYLGEEWALGELGGHVGIFPLNFVEVVEDLPPPAEQRQSRVALPGMAGSPKIQDTPTPSQAATQGVEWAVALYDFNAETEEDLPFRQGDLILVTAHIDEEWSSGRLNGREGLFPSAFIQPCSGGS